jgi:hypothetical protein
MRSFQFTNPYDKQGAVIIHAQQMHARQRPLIDFNGLAAGVSREAYMLTITICLLLFALQAENMLHKERFFGTVPGCRLS